MYYLPGTPVLSFGTAGCNLTCKFCQSWDISKARQLDRLQDAASPEDIVEAAIATGSRSIAYTYNAAPTPQNPLALRDRVPMLWSTCSGPEATMGGMLMEAPSNEFAQAGTLSS